MKPLIPITLLLLTLNPIDTTESKINWISVEEAYQNIRTNKKPVIIDVYTDWCGWCKRMDRDVFSNPTISKYINENFYAVKLDGEHKGDITLGDKTFKFINEGRRGYHELAAALLQGKLSYPTIVFLNKDFNMIQPIPGYKTTKEMEPILNFIGSGAYKNIEWTKFQKDFVSEL